jgi:hypothetical protein
MNWIRREVSLLPPHHSFIFFGNVVEKKPLSRVVVSVKDVIDQFG